jgi:hypothetical protein
VPPISPLTTARITAVAAYSRVKTPPSASRLVKRRPAGESGCTSMNPTVVMVMTVMYKQSRSDQPSSRAYPVVPAITSSTGTARVSRNSRRRTGRLICPAPEEVKAAGDRIAPP